MMRRFTGSIAAVVAAIIVVSSAFVLASPASAAQLSVKSPRIVTVSASRCTSATVATTAPSPGSSTVLRISNVPASCAGRSVSVQIVGTSGVMSTGTLSSATAGTNNVTVGSYATAGVVSVAVFFNTWWINNTWTKPAPPPAILCTSLALDGTPTGAPCTTSTPSVTTSGGQGNSPSYMAAQFMVNTTSPNYEVVINLADTTVFPGWTPGSVNGNGDSIAAPGYSCSELPVLRLARNTSNSSFVVYFEATTKEHFYNSSSTLICA